MCGSIKARQMDEAKVEKMAKVSSFMIDRHLRNS